MHRLELNSSIKIFVITVHNVFCQKQNLTLIVVFCRNIDLSKWGTIVLGHLWSLSVHFLKGKNGKAKVFQNELEIIISV